MEILSLGNKIKSIRKQKNMKLKDLAGDRITPGQISLIESGKSKPSEDLLKYLAEKLDTSIEYLQESEIKQAEEVCEFYAKIAKASMECDSYLRADENIQKGIHYAKEYNITLYEGVFNLLKAEWYFLQKHYVNAQKYGISALSIFLKIGDLENILNIFMFLGKVSFKEEKYNIAYNYFKEAEKAFNESKSIDKIKRIKIYYYIAKCLNKLNEHSKAIEYALIVEKEIKLIEDYRVYIDTLTILATSFAQSKEKNKALEYASFANEVCIKHEDNIYLANIQEDIGEIFVSSFNMEEGIEYLKRSLDIKKSIKGEDTSSTILKISKSFIKCGRYNKALEYLIALEEDLNIDINTRLDIIEQKIGIYKELNQENKQEEEIIILIKLLSSINNEEKLIYYYMLIGNFYKNRNEDKLALKYFGKAFEVKNKK